MTRSTLSLLALTLAATGVAGGFWLRHSSAPTATDEAGKTAPATVKLPALKGMGVSSGSSAAAGKGPAVTVSNDGSGPVGPTATPQALMRQHQAESARTTAPTRQELEWRAAKVEQEANHEMEKLVPLLKLTDDEQERVFSALVRRSAYYDSSMGAANAVGGASFAATTPSAGTSANSPATSSSGASNSGSGSASTPVASTAPARSATPVSSTAPVTDVAATDPAVAYQNPAPLDAVEGVTAEDLAANDPVYDSLPEEKKKAYLQDKQESADFWQGVMSKVEAQLKYGQ